ncbi:hypothetical protein NSQ38_10405 [Paenibacillus sp. FSL R7-0313]|uniref:hypothetical protein n=1 Tax=Paenibacillus sp. FSL R7-0313 TaxID=2954532 RepID=UPI0030D91040
MDQQKEGADEALSQLTDSRHLRHSEKMMRWIEEHFEYEMRLDQMAADVHLSTCPNRMLPVFFIKR